MKFEVYSYGVTSMSVCVPKKMTKKEIEKRANSAFPTGISSQWHISNNKTFRSGESMPCVCENDKNCLHWLLNC